jgi:Ca2+-binding RTX toxin-like protein
VGPDARNGQADANGGNWLQAASIGTMSINSVGNSVAGTVQFVTNMDNLPTVEVNVSNLIGLDLQSQQAGSRISVSGSALVTGLYFHDEVVTEINASALTNKVTHGSVNSDILTNADNNVAGPEDDNLAPLNAIGSKHDFTYSFYVIADDEVHGPASTGKGSSGFTFLGSVGSDFVYATGSTDNLSGNAGNDFLVGYAGDDTVDGGDGDDVLFGDDLGPSGNGATVFRETGNDVLIGGAGNDVLIGGNNGIAVVGGLLGDYLTGGAGNDAFVFHLETITDSLTVSTELGKSTNPTLKQDFITDFTPGQDTIFIQNDNGDNNYAIAYYNSVTADATFINAGAGDVQVVVRRGDYNLSTGTFTQFGVGSGTGADYQVLFMVDGNDFAGPVGVRLLAPGAWAGGGSDFNAASHEIAVLGLAAAGGSLSTADIVFYG